MRTGIDWLRLNTGGAKDRSLDGLDGWMDWGMNECMYAKHDRGKPPRPTIPT